MKIFFYKSILIFFLFLIGFHYSFNYVVKTTKRYIDNSLSKEKIEHIKTKIKDEMKVAVNKDKFISSGLWSKSRHPNYVGEITLWLGISIMSFSNLNGFELITLISPMFTYWLLVYVSGINILEKSGQKKWGHLESYKKYVKKTPQLFF